MLKRYTFLKLFDKLVGITENDISNSHIEFNLLT
jgi:hypothetical protein